MNLLFCLLQHLEPDKLLINSIWSVKTGHRSSNNGSIMTGQANSAGQTTFLLHLTISLHLPGSICSFQVSYHQKGHRHTHTISKAKTQSFDQQKNPKTEQRTRERERERAKNSIHQRLPHYPPPSPPPPSTAPATMPALADSSSAHRATSPSAPPRPAPSPSRPSLPPPSPRMISRSSLPIRLWSMSRVGWSSASELAPPPLSWSPSLASSSCRGS